jgi:DNA-binding transcriptional ArsR family regulator
MVSRIGLELATTEERSILFHGLADPSRLSIVEVLASGDHRVKDVAVATRLDRSNVSKHLARLFDWGLVERERQGRETHYRLTSGLPQLLDDADRILTLTGARVRSSARYRHQRDE